MEIDVTALPFVAFEERRQIPHESAVYFVVDANGEVIYVGRSVDIRNRWKGHHLLPVLARREGIRIAWLVPERRGRLAEVESALIAKYRPQLNVIGIRSGAPKPALVATEMDATFLARIDDYRWRHRFVSRSAAMRYLMSYALTNMCPTPRASEDAR